MTLEQWLKLHGPAIPQHIFDKLTPDEAERLARSRIDVSDHLRRNIEVDWDTWTTVFQDRRVIVQNAVAEPSQAFAPWKASRRETVFAVSADGVKVKGLVELANTGRWRLTQREQKVADELFPVIAPMLDSDGTELAHPARLYGKHTAPPANNSYRNGRDDAVAAWWLDPLSHENNLAQMRSDAAGFARLYTRTRKHDSAAGAALEAVIANYRRYIKLFELGTAPPCLDAKLEARVTTKQALKKLQGVT